MDHISMSEKRGANYVLLELKGAITATTFTEFQSKAFHLVRQGNLVLDLSETTKIDSSGMGVIMAAHNSAEDNAFKLYILRPSPEARRAIEATGFLDTFELIHSVTEVL